MRRQTPRFGIGTASLVVTFSVLCLTIFSLMALLTAMNERSITQRTAEAVQQYYQADTRAEHVRQGIYLAISQGEKPVSINDIAIEWGEHMIHYVCPVDENLQIAVTLILTPEGKLEVSEWKTGATGEWGSDNAVSVWNGEGA